MLDDFLEWVDRKLEHLLLAFFGWLYRIYYRFNRRDDGDWDDDDDNGDKS